MKWGSRVLIELSLSMAKRVYQSVSRSRKLTKAEAAKYRSLREEIERELPPAKPDALKVAIAQLRATREAKGLTLADVAARTGMTRGNIARLESQKNATLRTLECYATGLGCALEISVVAKSPQTGSREVVSHAAIDAKIGFGGSPT
jgi:DNA-binding Xre family transcriptional regulator